MERLLTGEIEKLERFWVRWQAKLKNWHAFGKLPCWHIYWYVGMLARNNENLARFWQVGMWTTLIRMTRDLANSQSPNIRTNSPCCNVLVRQIFVFRRLINKNVLECFLIITSKEHTLTRSTNFCSRNHPTLCFWLRKEGR